MMKPVDCNELYHRTFIELIPLMIYDIVISFALKTELINMKQIPRI